jgi:hypothetical protein
MTEKVKYEFSAEIWQHAGPAAWYFVSLPAALAAEIREHLQWQEEGWGRLKAVARIGDTQWETAIWYDTKQKTYLLPLKAEIRKREKLKAGQKIMIIVWV